MRSIDLCCCIVVEANGADTDTKGLRSDTTQSHNHTDKKRQTKRDRHKRERSVTVRDG